MTSGSRHCIPARTRPSATSAWADAFRAHFGREPELFVSAPGRTEVIGNHTDHNRGRVLAASVDLDTVAALAPRNDSVVTMYSEGYDQPFAVDLSDLAVREDEKETTFSLIRGVAARLKELGYRIGGFDASVTSAVFKGSGLSSSAALEVMLVASFDALYNGWTIDSQAQRRHLAVRRKRLLRQAQRPDGSDGQRGRRAGDDRFRPRRPGRRGAFVRFRREGLRRLRRLCRRRTRQPDRGLRGDSGGDEGRRAGDGREHAV